MIEISNDLKVKIEDTINDLGFYLYYIDQETIGNDIHLVIYVNKENFDPTISLDDCVDITHKINEFIDDYIDEEYILEISSSGINRKLYTQKHYEQANGEKIQVILNKKVEPYEKKKIQGIITNITEDGFKLDQNKIKYSEVKRANYVGGEGE